MSAEKEERTRTFGEGWLLSLWLAGSWPRKEKLPYGWEKDELLERKKDEEEKKATRLGSTNGEPD